MGRMGSLTCGAMINVLVEWGTERDWPGNYAGCRIFDRLPCDMDLVQHARTDENVQLAVGGDGSSMDQLIHQIMWRCASVARQVRCSR